MHEHMENEQSLKQFLANTGPHYNEDIFESKRSYSGVKHTNGAKLTCAFISYPNLF